MQKKCIHLHYWLAHIFLAKSKIVFAYAVIIFTLVLDIFVSLSDVNGCGLTGHLLRIDLGKTIEQKQMKHVVRFMIHMLISKEPKAFNSRYNLGNFSLVVCLHCPRPIHELIRLIR